MVHPSTGPWIPSGWMPCRQKGVLGSPIAAQMGACQSPSMHSLVHSGLLQCIAVQCSTRGGGLHWATSYLMAPHRAVLFRCIQVQSPPLQHRAKAHGKCSDPPCGVASFPDSHTTHLHCPAATCLPPPPPHKLQSSSSLLPPFPLWGQQGSLLYLACIGWCPCRMLTTRTRATSACESPWGNACLPT